LYLILISDGVLKGCGLGETLWIGLDPLCRMALSKFLVMSDESACRQVKSHLAVQAGGRSP
jgi:hypothetical protein